MSSRIAGGSGSFGATGCAADATSDESGAAASVVSLGATAFVFEATGTSGFTAVLVIFRAASSRFPSADFALALVADVAPSVDEATAGSAFGSTFLPESFFATGVLSDFGVSLTGVDGTIDAILSFSTSTYP